MVEFVDPELNKVEIVKEEDALLGCSFHLEVVVASLLVPAWLVNEIRLSDVTQFQDVVRRYGEFACIMVRYEDTFYWIDVDVALVAVEFEPMDFVQAALNPLEWVESSIGGF